MEVRMRVGRNSIRRHEKGIAYLWMLFLVFLLGIGLGKSVEIQSLAAQRSKEADLLYVGGIYKAAIKAYYIASVDGVHRYPDSMDVLLKDPRYPGVKRYLRKLYKDPVTNKPFELIYAAEGGVSGVRSSSSKLPLKQAGFSPEYEGLKSARSYHDWMFMYEGESSSAVPLKDGRVIQGSTQDG